MKFKAVITSLLLASSSVALADDLSFKRPYNDTTFHRGEWRRAPQWMPITQMLTANRRTVININERNDELRAIRLQNGSGATYVYSITLRYENGRPETINVGKWLYAGAPLLTFDVAQGRELDRVVVNTWTSTPSTFQLMAQKVARTGRPPIAHPPLPPVPPMPAPIGFVAGKDLTFAGTAGYVHLPVGPDKGSFQKLRLESTGTGTFVGRVYVTFPTGLHQAFEINRALYRGEVITFDLSGTAAKQITAVTVMAGNDVRAIGANASRFAVTLL